ncbi:MAG: hypothetical protein VKK32_00695 [Candidatus Melainabacteria bacterium]|nr:hypothetical protein [Candidatus Melainabacteria bacterium]
MARGKHKTVPRELKKNINWLENKLGVKIVLGISECARHKYPPGHIRLVKKTGAGFRARGYSGNGVIDFFIVCRDEEILELIVAKFEVSF